MITNSKKEQLMSNITSAIYANGNLYPPAGIDGPVYRELCQNINFAIKNTVQAAFEQLIKDLYTQEQFEKDLDLK